MWLWPQGVQSRGEAWEAGTEHQGRREAKDGEEEWPPGCRRSRGLAVFPRVPAPSPRGAGQQPRWSGPERRVRAPGGAREQRPVRGRSQHRSQHRCHHAGAFVPAGGWGLEYTRQASLSLLFLCPIQTVSGDPGQLSTFYTFCKIPSCSAECEEWKSLPRRCVVAAETK